MFIKKPHKADVLAGLTVAVFIIPQAMAYALLAGLPATVGLYTCLVPLLLYALVGTSPHVAMGPVALLSIMMASILAPYATAFEANYVALAIQLTLFCGVIQVILYALKAGRLMKFVDDAVIHGFISSAAITIVLSQMGHMLGIGRLGGDNAIDMTKALTTNANAFHLPTILFSAMACLFLFVMSKKAPKWPRAIIVVCIGAIMVSSGAITSLPCIDQPEQWLPSFSMPNWTIESLIQLFPGALLIAIVGYVESISLAKTFAEKTKVVIHSNREWLGLGVANLGSALTGGMVVAAGFSRSAVKMDVGTKSKMSGVFTVFWVSIALVLAQNALGFIPKAVLGAMVAMSVYKLIHLKALRTEFAISQRKGVAQLATFFGVIVFGIVWGFTLGLAIDLTWRLVHRIKGV